jgi:hypothetical protein
LAINSTTSTSLKSPRSGSTTVFLLEIKDSPKTMLIQGILHYLILYLIHHC